MVSLSEKRKRKAHHSRVADAILGEIDDVRRESGELSDETEEFASEPCPPPT